MQDFNQIQYLLIEIDVEEWEDEAEHGGTQPVAQAPDTRYHALHQPLQKCSD